MKITQGNCLELIKEIPTGSIDLILTDPPYGMEFRSNHRKEKHEIIENDNNLEWLPDFAKESFRVLKDNTHAYFFCSFHNVDIFKQEFQKYFTVKNILIWEKNNTGMGDLFGDYAPKYEMILFCVKGSKKLHGNRDSNIIKAQKTHNEFHPTEKPVELMKYFIEKSSEVGGVVLDPFCGSGSTLLGAKSLSRDFIGYEINEKYYQTALKRLEGVSYSLF